MLQYNHYKISIKRQSKSTQYSKELNTSEVNTHESGRGHDPNICCIKCKITTIFEEKPPNVETQNKMWTSNGLTEPQKLQQSLQCP